MTSHQRVLAALATGALALPLMTAPAAFAQTAPTPTPAERSIAAFCAGSPDRGFTDVPAGFNFRDAINCLAAAGITQGLQGGNTYGPAVSVNRDQMASFIARMIDTADRLDTGTNVRALPAAGANTFTDVAANNVHRDNILRLAAAGIVQGGPGGRPATQFGPELDVTRAQMASFIVRAVNYMTGENLTTTTDYFTDDTNAQPHIANINTVASLGIAVGPGGGIYNPFQSVPRGQMAAFITRSLAFLNERGDIRPLNAPAPVTLTSASVQQGGNLTGTITGDFSSVTVSGCGLTNQTIVPDDNTTTAGRQFTLSVSGGQVVGNCNLTFTFTPTGGGASFTQVVPVTVTAGTVGASATARPELVAASVVSTVTSAQASTATPEGTTIRYTFDEPVTGGGFTAASFKAYTSAGVPVAGPPASAVLDPNDNRSVLVRFAGLNTAALANAVSVATVTPGAVTDNQGLGNPEGDAPLGASRTVTSGAAGVTSQPDLLSVGNFRASTTAGRTAVDFTFDQNAFPNTAAAATGLTLVATDGSVIQCTGPIATETTGGTNAVGGAGTAVLTATCQNPIAATTITATTIARGLAAADTVFSTAALAVTPAAGTGNPLQASNTPDANSVGPDLVSVTFTGGTGSNNDVAVFTFDSPVALTGGAAALGEFRVYDQNGGELQALAANVARSQQNASQVIVQFANAALTGFVGGNVREGAVQDFAATPNVNRADEVGVANPTTTTITPGRTAGPDLTAVALVVATTDPVTGANDFTARFTFDEAIATADGADFNIYLADGTPFRGGTCAVNGTTPTQVDCTAFTGATEAQIGAAVLGTVAASAVTSTVAAGGETNPEGAEVTTGGTGTPRTR